MLENGNRPSFSSGDGQTVWNRAEEAVEVHPSAQRAEAYAAAWATPLLNQNARRGLFTDLGMYDARVIALLLEAGCSSGADEEMRPR